MGSIRAIRFVALFVSLVLLPTGAASAYTIHAGITLDVHQDIPDGTLPGGRLPNDFHIEGQICTENGVIPVLDEHLDDIFPNFSHSLTKLNPGDPNDCWYTFTADWWLDAGEPGIPFCTVVHLGLLFFVEDENTMIDLVGWWTLDGQRVGDIIGGYANEGFVPVSGFYVDPVSTAGGPVFRIGVGEFPPLPPPVPPTPAPIDVMFTELDILSVQSLPPGWFGELQEGGAQDGWGWIPISHPDGSDINPSNPTPPLAPDSFFDVFFDLPAGSGAFTPDTPVTIPGDGLLIVRSKMNYINNAGVSYTPTGPGTSNGLWTWHIHQAQGEEACCFDGGSCMDLVPIDCVGQGGFPQGMGTTCATTFCPTAETEACCYADGACMDEPAGTCLANGGTPQGLGTDCASTTCPDPVEACCFADGRCEDLPPASCLAGGGVPQGPGTTCATAICTALPNQIYAGLTLDVHQDIPDDALPGGRQPNDFHVEGQICTAGGVAPVLVNHLDDVFPNFSHSLTKLNPADPGDCWYTFSADWWFDVGEEGIPYCTILHLGLLFYVEDENTMIDLRGWWTLDGQQVGNIIGGLPNGGYVPVPGFAVDPEDPIAGPDLRIGEGVFPPLPPITPSPQPIEIFFTELDVLAVPSLPEGWFDGLFVGGAQDSWGWVPVLDPIGNDINPLNPTPPLMPDSFFDVYFDMPAGSGEMSTATPVTVPPGGLLITRSRRNFVNNSGDGIPYPDGGLWLWHIHGEQAVEACCLGDGSCQDLTPDVCVAMGGFPQGDGTNCSTTTCPQATQACCLPDGTCMDLPPADCGNAGGVQEGPGTDCLTTVCDPQPVPSASMWGLVALAVSIMGASTVIVRRRGATS